jgi:methionyl-tRNA formyltransferase
VPARLLEAATYGGLNVHPSLLPDLRGPAPIQHALLHRKQHTGVSVQTMHPTTFDAGVVLAQSPLPGVAISESATVDDMIAKLGPLGAEMLVQTVSCGSFISPINAVSTALLPEQELRHAPKLGAKDHQIQWSHWDASEVILRSRVLGRLWDNDILRTLATHKATDSNSNTTKHVRVIFYGPWQQIRPVDVEWERLGAGHGAGRPFLYTCIDGDNSAEVKLGITCAGNEAVSPASATIAGGKTGRGVAVLKRQLKEAGHEVFRCSVS